MSFKLASSVLSKAHPLYPVCLLIEGRGRQNVFTLQLKVRNIFVQYGKVYCTLNPNDVLHIFGSDVGKIPIAKEDNILVPWTIKGEDTIFRIKCTSEDLANLQDPSEKYGFKTNVDMIATVAVGTYGDCPKPGVCGVFIKLKSPLLLTSQPLVG